MAEESGKEEHKETGSNESHPGSREENSGLSLLTSKEDTKKSVVESSETAQTCKEVEATGDGAVPVRGVWGREIQFILMCIGLAVGLGNIWRFPKLAYDNGGGAFLIPYVVCSLFFGLPILYFEFVIGQFTSSGASVAYGKYVPAFQGLGWGMTLVVSSICIYYNMILAWIGLYLVKIIGGEGDQIASCNNWWNTEYCESTLMDDWCRERHPNPSLSYFINGTCYPGDMRGQVHLLLPGNLTTVSPAEEFFEHYILQQSTGLTDWAEMNWKLLASLTFMWILVAIAISRGVDLMGKISYVTATTPYIIIAVLFVRGVTLDGSKKGIDFYLLKPNFTKIMEFEPWKEALVQVCYSLSIGEGAVLSLASYNKYNHFCFRDALIVAFADSFMSVFGGVAVFSTLGYLATQMNVDVEDVVQSGTQVAFVAYMEAAARMPLAWLWMLLFMLMLFFLGMSTQIGLADVMVTSICDQWPSTRRRKLLVVVPVCGVFFALGLVMTTGAGIYWFELIDAYCGTFALCFMNVTQIIVVMTFYGPSNFVRDIESMMGKSRSLMGRLVGPTGWYMKVEWCVVAPLLGLAMLVAAVIGQEPLSYGKGPRQYVYPGWANTLGWALGAIPILTLPFYIIVTFREFSAKRDWKGMFRARPSLRSWPRIHGLEEETTEFSLVNHASDLPVEA